MDEKKEASGGIRFVVICIVLAFLLIACVVCPLVIEGFSRQPYALPLMATGLLLPFLYFFIFGGAQVAADKKNK